MLHHRSLQAVAAARIDDDRGRPLHGSYCFSGLPGLVRACFGDDAAGPPRLPDDVLGGLPRRYDRVITILLDGFGWRSFDRLHEGLPFLRRAVDEGVAAKLTSQFPSTTAAHMTTLHTGAPVGESGVFEWFYYEPTLDRIYAPLLHATIEAEGLVGVDPERPPPLPAGTLYEALARVGVASTCLQDRRYAGSPFSRAACRGATMSAYATLPEALTDLAEAARAAVGPAYFCLYVDSIDHIAHRHGPGSPHLEAEVVGVAGLLEALLRPALARLAGETLVLISADHGHTAVDPGRTLYVDEWVPGCARWLRTDRRGRPLVPAGSPRDLFLYVDAAAIDEARGALARALEGRAEVLATATLIDEGAFGPDPSPRLRERLGELVILPRDGEMVWWRGGGRFTVDKRGHHGGLTADEMEIPLLACAYGR